ncbi:MAG TPA: hypothetical protein VGH27_01720 [Streptosporangiaceae bacterium]|jgi:catechol 2,3-dioxygenase-like lactoylglutathione lyase family enzyme
MAVNNLEVVSVPVSDQDRAKRFYAEQLGFSVVMDSQFGPQTLDELTARGVVFHEDEIQQAPWGRWKTFDDPDGNAWVLQQNTPGFTP